MQNLYIELEEVVNCALISKKDEYYFLMKKVFILKFHQKKLKIY